VRGAAASAPEAGAARRCFAGSSPAHPRSLHWASIRVRVSSTRSWGNHAHIQGFKRVARAPTVTDTEKGVARGSPACERQCCGLGSRREKTGIRCSPHKEGLKTITGEEGAATTVSNDGGSSGGASADGVEAPGGLKDVNLWQDMLSERRMQQKRGRKGDMKGPSPATSSSSGGGDRGGDARCMWCSKA
jgi:hypothetical protein